ncbi:hypothetical protein [Bdellovibrio sp. BCCA]|uniref:hypothetical protein n=1 Tax=Bdellovibrio sp. BCCA TaxID=3136281 RepID=UPI0030F2DB5C
MTRKNLFLIVIAFIVGVSVWIFFVNKSLKTTQDVIVQEATRPQRRVASLPSPTMTPNNAVKNQLQTEIQSLQQQITQERQKLVTQKMALDEATARQQQQQSVQQTPAAISSQITERTSQVQNFMEELKNYEYAEQDINRRATEALREQSSAAQVARDQIDENIRTQENLIRQTREQIAYWQGNLFYVNEREARLQDLQTLLETQTRQLQGMRDQRLALSAQILENTRALQSEKEQALSDLADSRSDLQDEIASLRIEINRLQGMQYQTRTSQMTTRSRLTQMQKDFETQNRQVQTLEASLQEKERQLKLLQ